MRSRHPRQRLLLAIAVGLIALAVTLVLVVTLRRGSDGPAAGSPDAVTDQLAAAVLAHSPARVGELSCAGDQRAVVRRLRGLTRDLATATRRGTAQVQGDVAVGLVGLRTSTSSSGSMTVALRQVGTTWCVTSIAPSIPSHG